MKTLQNQYIEITEGRGNKDHFLKQARYLFPELVTVNSTFNDTVKILKGKSILTEAVGGIVTQNPNKPDWFKIFNTNIKEAVGAKEIKVGDIIKHKSTGAKFEVTKISGNDIEGKYTEVGDLKGKVKIGDVNKTSKNLIGKTYELISEAVGVKDKKEYGDQNTFEKIDKDVAKDLESNFDNNDPKNIDNVYGQSFLMGYLAEMDDPKNATKTVDELKKIVAKNMAQDINYYAKNGMFGVKGIGLETSKEPKAPTGKYKSSGYGNLKESIYDSYDDMYGVDSEAENELIKNQRKYNQEIDWIKNEVDYVPDNIEVYGSWPEPYRSKALRALEYRKKNFKQMSDYKRDSFKENLKENKLRSIINTIIREELK